MRIVVLSRKGSLYSTRRLVEAGRARGHRVRVIDYTRCYLNVTAEKPTLHYRGQELNGVDAIIPRIGSPKTSYGTAVVRQFERAGIFTPNSADAIRRSRDKFAAFQLLTRQGIALPRTGFAGSAFDVKDLINTMGGPPFIIKLPEGAAGSGVALAETMQAAESVLTAFMGIHAEILIQEYIEESRGEDIRCFVVGDELVAAMKRRAKKGDFRSNLHRGGHGIKIRLTKEVKETALAAARTVGLNVCGVDIIISHRGPMVLEVNSTPGLEGIETVSGINVADKIISYIEKHAGQLHKPKLVANQSK